MASPSGRVHRLKKSSCASRNYLGFDPQGPVARLLSKGTWRRNLVWPNQRNWINKVKALPGQRIAPFFSNPTWIPSHEATRRGRRCRFEVLLVLGLAAFLPPSSEADELLNDFLGNRYLFAIGAATHLPKGKPQR